MNDFVSLTGLVTKENLQTLEASYHQSQGVSTGISFPQMQAAASRFLGRLWAGNSTRSIALNPNAPALSRPTSTIRRSPSKQSMTSTLNSIESASSDASTALTDLSTSNDAQKSRTKSAMSQNSKDRDLHTQIEDLLMALSDLQRQHADLTRELQKEREEREEDRQVAKAMLTYLREADVEEEPSDLIAKAEEIFESRPSKRVSIIQTKHQLRDDVNRWKEMHQVESTRCADLARRIDEHDKENAQLRDQLREARGRIQDGYRDRQRLERTIRDLRAINPMETTGSSPQSEPAGEAYTANGLRELRLVRSNSQKSAAASSTTAAFSKRSSSLGMQAVLGAAEQQKPASEETLLLELVNAKTAEAVAKQELEEVKAKLDALRKLVGGSNTSSGRQNTINNNNNINPRNSLGLSSNGNGNGNLSRVATDKPTTTTGAAGSSGGFFSGWGRRAASTSNEFPETK